MKFLLCTLAASGLALGCGDGAARAPSTYCADDVAPETLVCDGAEGSLEGGATRM